MDPESDSGGGTPGALRDGGTTGADLAETLLARVDDIEGQLRAIPAAADGKALKELRRTIEALSKRDPKFEERVTNRVDIVAERLETVAKTVSTTAAGLAARDGEVSQLRRELEAAMGRVDTAVADLRRSLDPAALPEIKRALAALSEQKLPRGVEGRMEDLNAKLGMLSQRVDTVSSTASTTAAGLAGRDGDVAALRRRYEAETARIDADVADLRQAIDPAPVVELRQAVKELSDATFGQKRSNQQQLDEVGARVDTLVGQLDALATAAAATTTRVSEGEEEISALRAAVEEGESRLSSLVVELKQTVAALAVRAAALEDANGETARLLDVRVSDVSGSVDDLAARLDSLTTTVATTTERVEKQGGELVEIERRFQEAGNRVEGLVADLMGALDEFPDPDSLEQAFQASLDELVGQVAEVGGKLTHVEATASEQARGAASGSAELARLLADERGKVDDLAGRLDLLTATVATTSERLRDRDVEIQALHSEIAQRVDSVEREREISTEATRTSERSNEIVGNLVEELAARLEATEKEQDGTSAEVARLAAILEVERASFRTRLDTLAAALSVPVSFSQHSSLEARLDELAKKLDDVDRRGAAVASDVSRATMLWPTALRSLEARLDEVAPGAREPGPGLEESSRHPLAVLESGIEPAEVVAAESVVPPEKVPDDGSSSPDTLGVGRDVTKVGAGIVRHRASDS